MNFNYSQLGTIKRALIIYNRNLFKGLRGKGFFIDRITLTTDIINIKDILDLLDEKII